MSPRMRSSDPTHAISVTLPVSLLAKINEQLSRTQSRSQWLAGAARLRLGESTSLAEIRTKSLLVELMMREDLDDDLKKLIEMRLMDAQHLENGS